MEEENGTERKRTERSTERNGTEQNGKEKRTGQNGREKENGREENGTERNGTERKKKEENGTERNKTERNGREEEMRRERKRTEDNSCFSQVRWILLAKVICLETAIFRLLAIPRSPFLLSRQEFHIPEPDQNTQRCLLGQRHLKGLSALKETCFFSWSCTSCPRRRTQSLSRTWCQTKRCSYSHQQQHLGCCLHLLHHLSKDEKSQYTLKQTPPVGGDKRSFGASTISPIHWWFGRGLSPRLPARKFSGLQFWHAQ